MPALRVAGTPKYHKISMVLPIMNVLGHPRPPTRTAVRLADMG